jgi:hypothetical protein
VELEQEIEQPPGHGGRQQPHFQHHDDVGEIGQAHPRAEHRHIPGLEAPGRRGQLGRRPLAEPCSETQGAEPAGPLARRGCALTR